MNQSTNPRQLSAYIPYDKSWLMRLGLLDLIHGRDQILDFIAHETNLNDDVLALGRAIRSWRSDRPIDVGESGTLFRFLQFTAWKQGEDKQFIKHGTLAERPIANDPSIAEWPQAKLLSLDHGTSQWASAAALNGDAERLADPPFKLALTYEAIAHWRSRTMADRDWIACRDQTIQRQAEAFARAMAGESLNFVPEQAEDYCFAAVFRLMSPEEGRRRWPALAGHESNRLESISLALDQALTNKPIDSRDHRVVQAIAMWGATRGHRLRFVHPKAVNKSWPQFWRFIEA